MSNLLKAAAENDVQKVHRLLKAGVDVDFSNHSNRTALHECTTGEVAKMLIESGADVDCQNDHNSTPLTLASEYGQVSKVKVLLESGACEDLQDNDGDTAAHCAAKRNQLDVMQLLFTEDPDLSLKNNLNMTALDIAQDRDYYMMEELIEQYLDDETSKKANISPKINDDDELACDDEAYGIAAYPLCPYTEETESDSDAEDGCMVIYDD